MINAFGLHMELIQASLPIQGVDSDGAISWIGTPTAPQLATAAGIVAAHDGVAWVARIAGWVAKRAAARTSAKDIPNFATWTFAQWTTYRDQVPRLDATGINGIASLADAKPFLIKMATVLDGLAKMAIAERDWAWGDLADYANGVITYGASHQIG